MYVRLRYMFECNWMFRSVKSRSLEVSLAALPQVVALDRQMNDCKDDLSQVRRTVKEDHKTHLHNLEIAMWDSYCAFSHRICLAHMWELQLGPELQIVDWMLIVVCSSTMHWWIFVIRFSDWNQVDPHTTWNLIDCDPSLDLLRMIRLPHKLDQ